MRQGVPKKWHHVFCGSSETDGTQKQVRRKFRVRHARYIWRRRQDRRPLLWFAVDVLGDRSREVVDGFSSRCVPIRPPQLLGGVGAGNIDLDHIGNIDMLKQTTVNMSSSENRDHLLPRGLLNLNSPQGPESLDDCTVLRAPREPEILPWFVA